MICPRSWRIEKKLLRLFELLLLDQITTLPDGSRITVTASEGGKLGFGDPAICIRVIDNGPGLSEDALRSVFDPFFVRSDTEMEFGINLIACYFVVYHHGGTLQVSNREEGGAKFEILLPLRPNVHSAVEEENRYLTRVMALDNLWLHLLSGGQPDYLEADSTQSVAQHSSSVSRLLKKSEKSTFSVA